MVKVLVLFYSMYGHVHRLAEEVAKGAKGVEGVQVDLKRVPETLSDEILEQSGAMEARQKMAGIPECNPQELADYDAIIFGTPTRFGNMAGQMRQFLDSTGGLWAAGALVGKPGSVFTSSGTQHGGQESTLLSFHTTLLHHGMIIVGLPYTFYGQTRTDEVTGGTPYGATTISGFQDDRRPSDNELEGARFQGRHVASLAQKLVS